MPVIKRDRLPDDHPFSRGLIIFGQKRPKASTKPSPVGESSTSEPHGPLPDEVQMTLHNLKENAALSIENEDHLNLQSDQRDKIISKFEDKNCLTGKASFLYSKGAAKN